MNISWVLAWLSCTIFTCRAIEFEANGYKDVVVAIHPDVSSDNGEQIVKGIKVSKAKPDLLL
jgi:hypothetical protein